MPAYTRQQVLTEFPWLRDVPALADNIADWLTKGYGPDEILYQVRRTSVYRNQMFPGMFDENDRMRFDSEASYISTMRDYQATLRNYIPNTETRYDSFRELQGFVQGDISPRELEDRLKIWHQITNSSQPVKDAYYVYAGLELTDEQIYAATVDPSAYKHLKRQYDARVTQLTTSQQVFDRMTERTAANLGALVSDMSDQGIITEAEADRLVRGINPQRVGRWINAMLTEAQRRAAGEREYMGLADLQQALNYALIGSAASQQGFDLPDESRIGALVDAGVDRAKALETYGVMARQGGFIAGALQRSGMGQGTMEEVEAGLFGVGDKGQAARLDWALRTEEARGSERSGASFGQTRQGQLVQQGLRANRAG
jgi:hypothetical protein